MASGSAGRWVGARQGDGARAAEGRRDRTPPRPDTAATGHRRDRTPPRPGGATHGWPRGPVRRTDATTGPASFTAPHGRATSPGTSMPHPSRGRDRSEIGESAPMPTLDPYRTLLVHPEADAEIIQAAYRKLAQRYHPDVAGSPDAAARMAELNAARDLLADPERRAAYDRAAARRDRSPGADSRPGHRGRSSAPEERTARGRSAAGGAPRLARRSAGRSRGGRSGPRPPGGDDPALRALRGLVARRGRPGRPRVHRVARPDADRAIPPRGARRASPAGGTAGSRGGGGPTGAVQGTLTGRRPRPRPRARRPAAVAGAGESEQTPPTAAPQFRAVSFSTRLACTGMRPRRAGSLPSQPRRQPVATDNAAPAGGEASTCGSAGPAGGAAWRQASRLVG